MDFAMKKETMLAQVMLAAAYFFIQEIFIYLFRIRRTHRITVEINFFLMSESRNRTN